MSTLNFEEVDLINFPSLTKGQIAQLLHLLIPGTILLILLGVDGILDLTILSLMFWGLLYYRRPQNIGYQGGKGKTSLWWGSFPTIVLQCFLTMWGRAGNLGSYITANTGLLFSFLFMMTLSKAFFLGISFALFIAELIMFFLYFLSINNCVSSSSLLSLVFVSEQILIIL